MAKRRRKRQPTIPRDFDGPAKTTDGQVMKVEGFSDRSEHGQIIAAKRFRNIGEHPLTLAYERKQISEELYNAGNTFRIMFEKMERSGKDSTQALMAPGGGGSGTPWTDEQSRAIRVIQALEEIMPNRDYRIIRKFCGEGRSITESVTSVTPCHPNVAKWRLAEALEQLMDALPKVNKLRSKHAA